MEGQNYKTPLITDDTNYRIRAFKIFGGLQISLGLLCGILSISEVIIDGINMNTNCTRDDNKYGYNNCQVVEDADTLLACDLICLFFSGWFILTGIVPFCMTENRRHNWQCLKMTFMVLCLIGACIFVPSVFTFAIFGALLRGTTDSGALAALPSFVALFALAEFAVAIVAASFCCCCSTSITTSRTRRVIATANYTGDAMSTNGYSFGSTSEHQINTTGSANQPPP